MLLCSGCRLTPMPTAWPVTSHVPSMETRLSWAAAGAAAGTRRTRLTDSARFTIPSFARKALFIVGLGRGLCQCYGSAVPVGMARKPRIRLDQALVERGLAESRAAAQRLVMAGLVFSGERRLDKPGHAVAGETSIE